MRVTRYADGGAFLEAAEPFLLRAEAENGLLLGVSAWLAQAPARAETPYLATVHEGTEVVGCALRTPPQNLLLSRMPPAALAALADDVAQRYDRLPGIMAPGPDAAAFAREWSSRTHHEHTAGVRQRIYAIERIEPQRKRAPGQLRTALDADLEVAARWVAGFVREALPSQSVNAREDAAARIRRGSLFFWDDQQPVSMAAWVGKTPSGVRLNLVYTPEEYRGRGYAGACVSALSARLLEEGNRFCFLYADLANPISNRVYTSIGYQVVADCTEYLFTA
jgi:hypothetical protein